MEDSVAGPGLAGARCCWLWSMCHRFAQQKGDGTSIASGPRGLWASRRRLSRLDRTAPMEPAAWRTGA